MFSTLLNASLFTVGYKLFWQVGIFTGDGKTRTVMTLCNVV